MHPHPKFAWTDRAAMTAFVADAGFGTLFAMTPAGPAAVQVPVVWIAEGVLGLHLSLRNRITPHLDGATGLFSVLGTHGYISPHWYGEGTPEVPTWNYVSVELDGRLVKTGRDDLVTQIEALAHANEARLAPKPEWEMDEVPGEKIDAMLHAIAGFRFEVTEWRGTRKLGQTKPEAARLSAAEAVAALGDSALADAMRDA